MWRSGTEIVADKLSQDSDLIDRQILLNMIVIELHETVHRNQFRTL